MQDFRAGDVVMVHLDDTAGPRYWESATVRECVPGNGVSVTMDRTGYTPCVAKGSVRALTSAEADAVQFHGRAASAYLG